MSLRVFATLLAAVLVAAACGGESTSPNGNGNGNGNGGPVQTTSVDVDDNFFDPDDIVVSPGATVTWTWVGQAQHNVTFDDTSLNSSATKASGGHQQTFDDTGRFTYFCTVHGRAVMSGEVNVE